MALISGCLFTKMLQLLGDSIPQAPCRRFAPGPHWGTSIPQTPFLPPPPIQLSGSGLVPYAAVYSAYS